VEVRRATISDVPAIAAVHVGSWEAAYRGAIPDEVIDGLTVARRTRQWESWLGAGAVLFVATDDDRIIGFCAVQRSESEPGAAGEVTAVYVDPGEIRRGGGRRLTARGLQWMRREGLEEAVSWVLAANREARRFYEALGWHTDGTEQTDETFGTPLRLVRYRIRL
jgi:L-amino acid N-acyltransferase YncA